MRWFSCVPVIVIATVWAPCVGAFERQWQAGVDLGYAGVSWNDEFHGGLGGGVHMAYGMTDAFNWMLEVGGSGHKVCDDCKRLQVLHAASGVAYTLDIIQWVPYLGLLVGGYRWSGAEEASAQYKLGFQGALGFDYRPSRSWAVGVQLRYHTFLDDPFTAHYMTTFGRFELLWGW